MSERVDTQQEALERAVKDTETYIGRAVNGTYRVVTDVVGRSGFGISVKHAADTVLPSAMCCIAIRDPRKSWYCDIDYIIFDLVAVYYNVCVQNLFP